MDNLPSVELQFGAEKFIVELPLTVGQLRNYQPAMVKFRGLATEDSYDCLFNAFLAVIDKEKYPAMCRSYMEKLRTTPTELLEQADKLGYAAGVFIKAEKKDGDKAEATDTGEAKAS